MIQESYDIIFDIEREPVYLIGFLKNRILRRLKDHVEIVDLKDSSRERGELKIFRDYRDGNNLMIDVSDKEVEISRVSIRDNDPKSIKDFVEKQTGLKLHRTYI